MLRVCVYLTGCLDAEDGHPHLRVTLELVDQLDSLGGRDAAVDPDVTGLQRHNICFLGEICDVAPLNII